jgi:hypothetical protein
MFLIQGTRSLEILVDSDTFQSPRAGTWGSEGNAAVVTLSEWFLFTSARFFDPLRMTNG